MLSRYKNFTALGTPGEGLLFRADDTLQDRPVALRFLVGDETPGGEALPDATVRSQVRVGLVHPNVCAIYETGTVDAGEEEALGSDCTLPAGTPFVAMEFVKGYSLAAELRGGVPMEPDELLEIAVGLAQGLAIAHEQGIVHGALRPTSVMLTPDGGAKILDLGLSRGVRAADVAPPAAVYVSPEQASGESAGTRSDLFALGAMLYEMATGTPAFGSSTEATFREVLEAEPRPLDELRPELPASLARIVARCLSKDPEARYRDTRELVGDLRRVQRRPDPGTRGGGARASSDRLRGLLAPVVQAVRRELNRRSTRQKSIAGVVAGLLLVTAGGWLFLAGRGSTLEMSRRQLTHASPDSNVRGAAIAPDGASLAYADEAGLHLLDIESSSTGTVAVPDGVMVEQPAWSPDGRRLYFVKREGVNAEGSIWAVSPAGGKPVLLRAEGQSPAVSPDATTVAFTTGGSLGSALWTMGSDGSEARKITSGRDYYYQFPAWSPDGKRLAFIRIDRDFGETAIVTRGVEGDGAAVAVTSDFDQGAGPRWTPDGRVVFARTDGESRASLWSRRVDRDGRVVGESMQVASVPDASSVQGITISANGKRLVFIPVRTQVDTYVARLTTAGALRTPRRVTLGQTDDYPVAWTDGGSHLVLDAEKNGKHEILRQPAAGGEPERLGAGRPFAVSGGSILYASREGGALGLSRIAVGGTVSGPLASLPKDADSGHTPVRCAQSKGGRCLLGLKQGEQLALYTLDETRPGGRGSLLTKVPLRERDYGWNLSPDGSRVAVVNGGRRVRIVTLRSKKTRELTLRKSVYTQSVAWSSDGRKLYLTGMILHGAGGFVLIELDLGRARSEVVWETTDRWFAGPVPSPRGDSLALAARTIDRNAWMLENF